MKKSIAVIGGDLRSLKLIELLADDGFEVYTLGFDLAYELDDYPNVYFCKDLKEISTKSKVIVGSIPFTGDKVNILTTFTANKITIEDFMKIVKNKKVIGGNFSEDIRKQFESLNVEYIDLIKREEFSVLNAIATAEGTLEILLRETQRTVHGSKVLVMGFGRVGKVLSNKLLGIGADVYCEARKDEDLAWIKAYGYNPINLSELDKNLDKFDIIINTIPSEILNSSRLNLVKKDVLLIDLASNPGGIDRKAAKDKKLKLIWALSLPGKVAPITSAEYIKETLDHVLKEIK